VAVEELFPRSSPRTESGVGERLRRFSRPDARPGVPRVVAAASLVAALLAVASYWWWPGVTGRGESFDSEPAVLVVGAGQLERSQEKVLRRLREEGFSALWGGTPTDWCGVRDVLSNTDTVPTRAVVLHVPPSDVACTSADDTEPSGMAAEIVALVESFDSRAVLVIGLEVGDRDDPVTRSLVDLGVTVVDPVDLIGDPARAGERVDCLWWDDCVVEGLNPGYVILRDDDGLTAAGQQRVARLIVATVQ